MVYIQLDLKKEITGSISNLPNLLWLKAWYILVVLNVSSVAILAGWLYTVKTKCTYHTNGGTVGVLITEIKVWLALCGVEY